MSMPASPRPWKLAGNTIWDADGGVVVSALNPCDRATRRLIVAAVNEREAVREALRDMEADAEAAWEGTPLRRVLVKHVTALREALAALGEN